MTKEEIEDAFDTDFSDPGSTKSGEYLAEHVLMRAKRLIHKERDGLVQVLKSWIQQRSESRTMLAVEVAGDLRIGELRTEIDALGSAIKRGEYFLPFYFQAIERALTSIEK
jgi:hypothetical protein